MLGLVGRRKRLTLRGKKFGWRLASDAFASVSNSLDRELTEDDLPLILARVESLRGTEVIPPWIWQLVLAYIAQIIINWIVEKYLTPPQFPATELGDDDEVAE